MVMNGLIWECTYLDGFTFERLSMYPSLTKSISNLI